MSGIFVRGMRRFDKNTRRANPSNKRARGRMYDMYEEDDMDYLDELQGTLMPKETVEETLKKLLDEKDNQLNDKLDEIKKDLSEQVHKECVSCYRNVQDVLEEYKNKEDNTDEIQKGIKRSLRGVKVGLGFTIFFILCNIAVVVLHIFGII